MEMFLFHLRVRLKVKNEFVLLFFSINFRSITNAYSYYNKAIHRAEKASESNITTNGVFTFALLFKLGARVGGSVYG